MCEVVEFRQARQPKVDSMLGQACILGLRLWIRGFGGASIIPRDQNPVPRAWSLLTY